MIRAALAFSVLLPVGALAQTPADLARLMGPQNAVSSASAPVDLSAVVAGGGTAVDLARLAPASGSGLSQAPGRAVSGGAFAAADLARLTAAGVATWSAAPGLTVAGKE